MDEQQSLNSPVASHLVCEYVMLLSPFRVLGSLETKGNDWPVQHVTFQANCFRKILPLNSGDKRFERDKYSLFFVLAAFSV